MGKASGRRSETPGSFTSRFASLTLASPEERAGRRWKSLVRGFAQALPAPQPMRKDARGDTREPRKVWGGNRKGRVTLLQASGLFGSGQTMCAGSHTSGTAVSSVTGNLTRGEPGHDDADRPANPDPDRSGRVLPRVLLPSGCNRWDRQLVPHRHSRGGRHHSGNGLTPRTGAGPGRGHGRR
jgi:hypothetical protein